MRRQAGPSRPPHPGDRRRPSDTAWPTDPGDYALVWHLAEAVPDVAVGRLGRFHLAAGTWVYVGSARGPGGLRARLERHLRADKVTHWHIDHLTAALPPPLAIAVAEAPGAWDRLECQWVARLLDIRGFTAPIPGFGSGDCVVGCPAHLVHHHQRIEVGTIRRWLAGAGP